MAEDFQVRTVRVELLRAGPAHNQLLSPLTPYLAVCDDAEASVVTVPFEQHTFERRMRDVRWTGKAPEPLTDINIHWGGLGLKGAVNNWSCWSNPTWRSRRRCSNRSRPNASA